VRTTIRAAGDTSNIYWAYTDHNIQDLLMVAFQLALATNVNQSVLIISHLETVCTIIYNLYLYICVYTKEKTNVIIFLFV